MSSAVGAQYLKVVSVTSPLVFPNVVLAALRSMCGSVLYLSSAQPMAHRLAHTLWNDESAERLQNNQLTRCVAAVVDLFPLFSVERGYEAFP